MPWTESQKEKYKKKYAERKRKGLCFQCGNPASQGHVRCDKCLRQMNARTRNIKRFHRMRGLCANCSSFSGESHLCDRCKQVSARAVARCRSSYKRDGKCVWCATPLTVWDAGVLCNDCAEKIKLRRRNVL